MKRQKKVCFMESCNKPVEKSGFCHMHLRKWVEHTLNDVNITTELAEKKLLALTLKQKQLIEYLENQKDKTASFRQTVENNTDMSEAWVYRQEFSIALIDILQVVKEYDPRAGRGIKCFKIRKIASSIKTQKGSK